MYHKSDLGARKIAVVFSSAQATGFTYFKTFKAFEGIDVVFIRDPYYTSWYLNGIDATYNDWDGLVRYLSILLSSYSLEDISFWGSSMGGYAAIRASIHFPGSFCMAISPQTVISTSLPHNLNKNFQDLASNSDNLCLSELESDRYCVIYGSADVVDLFYMFSSGIADSLLFPLKGGDHLCSVLIHKAHVLAEAIGLWIDGRSSSIMSLVASSAMWHRERYFEFPIRDLISRLVSSFYFESDYQESLNLISELIQVECGIAGVYLIKGRILAELGRISDCIESFNVASVFSLSNLEPSKQLAKILVRSGHFKEALPYLDDALKIRHNDFDSLCLLAEASFEIGLIDQALVSLAKAKAIRPSHSRHSKLAIRFGFDFP
ncbi:MAG: tetratricopeptide repeat protein [Proteobacteria bacterium]|nr:tetratricopeptide repeat protein [Pseudomonadota bacterium]